MSQRTATCPNCGAPIQFRWSSAVQTTCAFCKSILVRHDVDLEKVGVVGDLPPSVSPIQLGTEGRCGRTAFVVVGRIVYQYERGRWNEWHLRMTDGTSAWMSDAQAEYAITRPAASAAPLPAAAQLRVGQSLALGGREFVVASITRARYAGVEGELPFTTWDREEALFADLETTDDAAHDAERADASDAFGTIDYADDEPVLYLGEYVTLDELQLRNLREIAGW